MKKEFTPRDLKKSVRNGAFAWPGGYPIYFVTADGGALGFDAVRDNFRLVLSAVRRGDDEQWRVIGAEINWENTSLCCDHTGKSIESAYGAEN